MSRKVAWLGLALSVACLGFFAWNASWKEIGDALAGVRPLPVVIAIFWMLMTLVGRAWRWRVLFGDQLVTSFRHRLTTTAIGFMGNGIFPGRLGEPLRCLMLSRLEPKVTFTGALATVLVERVFDMIATLAALVIFLIAAPFPAEVFQRHGDFFAKIRSLGWLFAAALVALFTVLVFMAHRPEQARRLAGWSLAFLPERFGKAILGILDSFQQGLATFRSWGALLRTVLFTAVVWLCILLSDLYMLRAFGLEHLGLVHALGVMVVLCFAVALPQAPGYIGVFQIASEKALTGLYGVPVVEAKAFAIGLWACQLLPIIAAGFVAVWYEGLSLGEVRRMEQEVEHG